MNLLISGFYLSLPALFFFLFFWQIHDFYLSYRDPIVINVSYFFQFQDDPKNRTQLSRAATLIQGAMDFKQKLLRLAFLAIFIFSLRLIKLLS